MRLGIFALLGLLIIASPAAAASSAEATCDRLAAWGGDKTKPIGVPGVEFSSIDAAHAVPACREAVKEHPSPRLYYQLGRSLEAQKDETESIDWYKKAAEGGHVKAMVQLGFAYSDYLKAPKQAFTWYKKAADLGDPLGQQGLGVLYRDGIGVAQNDAEALRLFKLSADQGYVDGEVALAWMYYNGRGTPVDYKKAAALYRKAAAKNNPDALYTLGLIYENGYGVAKDEDKAVDYYQRAQKAGSAEALGRLLQLEDDYLAAKTQEQGGPWAVCDAKCRKAESTCDANNNNRTGSQPEEDCITVYQTCVDGCPGIKH